ncbi:hypothetical protein [Streptomyces malaysiensis]|uniref:hypothetical protein n=1 Tax=Streptomyces malaysiensis TaxID=92644 RepID=UPI0008536E84|nr:hypothetical protein [Streptomyces sp. SPMA113]
MERGEKRKRVPRQRGLAPGELCPDVELCPKAQQQWNAGMAKVPALRRLVFALTGAQRTHIDDVMSKVLLAYFARLKSGPLEGEVSAYLRTITQRQAWRHLEELRDRAEEFVGDETDRLEDPNAHISGSLISKVALQQACGSFGRNSATSS